MAMFSKLLTRTTTSPDRSVDLVDRWPGSVTANSECIGNSVDIIEPRRDQGDLQDGTVVETGAPQPIVIQGRDLGCVPGKLDHVIDHHSLSGGDRCGGVIIFQRLDERVIQGDPTQKLCV
jgi:hypothetical protein